MTWKPLFGITIQHNFFSTTLGPLLDFVPIFETQAIIRSSGMISRAESNRIILCYDDEREEILRSCIPTDTGRLDFIFNIYALDPQYELYTDMSLSSSGTSPCYSSSEKSVALENGLHLETISGAAAKELANRATPDGDRRHPVKQPVFNVSISIAQQDSLEHQEYLIGCEARTTYWKYYILGELARQETEIIDLRGDIQFLRSDSQTPFPNREAAVFYSSEPIPLEERPNKQFQLRRPGSNGNKVLIKRLPNASVENLAKDIIKGKEVNVSEIYINY